MKIEHYKTAEEAIAMALYMGMEVIEADDKMLLLDLDDETRVAEFKRCLAIVDPRGKLKIADCWHSKSGKGIHVQIELPTPKPIEDRLRLQSLLASDPVREALHWLSFEESDAVRVLAFKPRGAKRIWP